MACDSLVVNGQVMNKNAGKIKGFYIESNNMLYIVTEGGDITIPLEV